jgi:arsenite methyltransferase
MKRKTHLLALGAVLLLIVPAVLAENRDQWQQPDRVLTDVRLEPTARVADVGCGGGYFTFRLARAVGLAGRVIAVDVSAEALKALSERTQKEGRANIEVQRSSPQALGFAPATLDAAFFCNVHHEMVPADRLPLMQDVARALKPGGMLYLIDWRKSHDVTFDPYEKLIPREGLLELGARAGLVLDAEFHYLKYQVFLRFRKPAGVD